jgi:hypothetical protein
LEDRELTVQERQNFVVIGSVTSTFSSFQFFHIPNIASIKNKAYSELRKKAQKQYSGNVDIRNVVISGGFSAINIPWIIAFYGPVWSNWQTISASGDVVQYNPTGQSAINIQINNSNTNSSNSGGDNQTASAAEARTPREGESEVVVQNSTSDKFKRLNIFIDGDLAGQVERNGSNRLIVKNGNHQIVVKDYLDNNKRRVNPTEFTVNSNRIVFEVTSSFLGNLVLSEPRITAIVSETTGIESAVGRALDALKESIPDQSTIAVLGISSTNMDIATIAVEDLEFRLVESKRFNMVDRKAIDAIRMEQDFQMSGDVSDDSAVSIGGMLGASIVITGSVSESGSSRRLTLKALDVKTARIIGMAREQL